MAKISISHFYIFHLFVIMIEKAQLLNNSSCAMQKLSLWKIDRIRLPISEGITPLPPPPHSGQFYIKICKIIFTGPKFVSISFEPKQTHFS